MSLKDLYESWTFRREMPVGGNASATPRQQASGQVGVDFLPNTFQQEFTPRPLGDKTVLLETNPEKTKGTFHETTALRYYTTLFSDSLRRVFGGKTVHKYNAAGTSPNDRYLTSDGISGTPGANY